jgi:hypothetical protein
MQTLHRSRTDLPPCKNVGLHEDILFELQIVLCIHIRTT